MRSRKAEIQSIVEILSAEHDSVEDLAGDVWKLMDSMRKGRDAWVVVVNHGHPLYLAYGIFETSNAAMKELNKFRSTTGNERGFVMKMVDPSSMFDTDFDSYK